MKAPKLGIIKDGNPNAFTYGYGQGYARIAITTGLLEVLDEDEVKAVVAHEIGHIKHNDFIAMMIISLIPMVLYQIYAWTKRSDKSKPVYWIGIGAYIVYILSQYLVLVFSRMREYYADNFSRRIMGNGEALKNSLIKIAYGYTAKEKKTALAIGSLGFANLAQSEGLVLGYGKQNGRLHNIERLIKWDLNNIWSRWYEINSTHPLTAKRIIALDDKNTYPSRISLTIAVKFLLEAMISVLPWTIVIATGLYAVANDEIGSFLRSILSIFISNPLIVVALGLTILIKYYYSYRNNFESYTIEELLQMENASPVAGIPAIIEGRIIGKGIPGLFYSEDLVVDDGTSIMIIDYRQPLRISEFLFGVLKADEIQDRTVKIIGWYKRGMRPYFCCKVIIDGDSKIKSYSYITSQISGYLLIMAGIVKMFL
jgi:heat shock protein HtpX